MSCTSEKSALRATTLFGLLYVLSGAFITSVGIYTMQHLPELFTTGSVIWSGIIVFGLGVTAVMFACCGSVSFRKGIILVVIASLVMVVCVLNILLLETIEWKYGIPPLPIPDPDKERHRDYLFFLTCLLSLFGTVVGLVTSVCNLLYAYCILLVPFKQLEKKRDIMKERVQLHYSMKKPSPRGIPDGKINSRPPTRSSSPEQSKFNSLPKSEPEKHHDWVYQDTSSELSRSSAEVTEMVVNKAFFNEIRDTPVHVNSSQENHSPAVATDHQPTPEPVEVVDSGYQWKRRTSSFRVDVVNENRRLTTAKSIDIGEIGQSRKEKCSRFQQSASVDDERQNLEDVHAVFNQLEMALNASLYPENNQAEISPNSDTMPSSNDHNSQCVPSMEGTQTASDCMDDLMEMSSTRL